LLRRTGAKRDPVVGRLVDALAKLGGRIGPTFRICGLDPRGTGGHALALPVSRQSVVAPCLPGVECFLGFWIDPVVVFVVFILRAAAAFGPGLRSCLDVAELGLRVL